MRRLRSGTLALTVKATLLLAGLSARALAFSARRAGFAAIAFDAFGDGDTRAACCETVLLENAMGGFAGLDLAGMVADRAREHTAMGFVYGSGFDDCPERLAEIAQATRILGSSAEALARAKDPRGFASACAAAGLDHPEIAFAAPDAPSDWLIKRRGGAGGLHIREGRLGSDLAPGEYWQRRIEGRPISLMFSRDRDAMTPIAWSEQWTSPSAGAPFRYGGAAGPVEGAPALLPALAAVTQALGVVGLASADFLDDGERYWLTEINPRPGATLDIFDRDDDPLMSRHLAACDDRPAPAPKPRSPRASETVYAEADCVVPLEDLPEWVADRPAPGARIPRGAPICTVLAAGPSVTAAKAEVRARGALVSEWFQEELG
jgi:predicted ATP-grasp superfamily ATP-dependent carboligase